MNTTVERWARAYPNKDRAASHAGHKRTTCSRQPGNQTHCKATGNNDVAQQKFLAQNTIKHTASLKTQSVAVFVPTKQKQVTNCNKQAHQGEATNVPQNEAHSVQHRVPRQRDNGVKRHHCPSQRKQTSINNRGIWQTQQ